MIGRLADRLSGLVGSSGDRGGADGARGDSDDGDDDGSFWDLTPDWQVGGYRLQGASVPRDEQQDAVREVREQASEMERELDEY